MPANFQWQTERRSHGKWVGSNWVEGAVADAQKHRAAKLNYKPTTLEDHRLADESEALLSEELGLPRTSDNEPFDLKSEKHGVEVKTLIKNTNDKITMRKEALERKLEHARQFKLTPHTIVIDRRSKTPAYYYSAGLGSFRIGSMKKMPLSELKKVFS